MNTLWLFTATPDPENTGILVRLVRDGDTVVFIQNGVYALMHGGMDIKMACFGLKADIEARGVTTDASQIDHSELVDLILSHKRTITL